MVFHTIIETFNVRTALIRKISFGYACDQRYSWPIIFFIELFLRNTETATRFKHRIILLVHCDKTNQPNIVAWNFITKRLQHRYFPVNFVKHLLTAETTTNMQHLSDSSGNAEANVRNNLVYQKVFKIPLKKDLFKENSKETKKLREIMMSSPPSLTVSVNF